MGAIYSGFTFLFAYNNNFAYNLSFVIDKVHTRFRELEQALYRRIAFKVSVSLYLYTGFCVDESLFAAG